MIVESGEDGVINTIDSIIKGRCSQIYAIVFKEGLTIYCTDTHRFIRSFQDGTGITAFDAKVGDIFQGRDANSHTNIKLTVTEKSIIFANNSNIVALKIAKKGKFTPYYAGGDGKSGIFCFFHNRKIDPDEGFIE